MIFQRKKEATYSLEDQSDDLPHPSESCIAHYRTLAGEQPEAHTCKQDDFVLLWIAAVCGDEVREVRVCVDMHVHVCE
jgi:hypothetical protein